MNALKAGEVGLECPLPTTVRPAGRKLMCPYLNLSHSWGAAQGYDPIFVSRIHCNKSGYQS
jgi:hypothetical protein